MRGPRLTIRTLMIVVGAAGLACGLVAEAARGSIVAGLLLILLYPILWAFPCAFLIDLADGFLAGIGDRPAPRTPCERGPDRFSGADRPPDDPPS